MQVRVFGSWLLLADEDVVRPNPGYRVRVRVRVRVGIPRPSDPDPNPYPNLYLLSSGKPSGKPSGSAGRLGRRRSRSSFSRTEAWPRWGRAWSPGR